MSEMDSNGFAPIAAALAAAVGADLEGDAQPDDRGRGTTIRTNSNLVESRIDPLLDAVPLPEPQQLAGKDVLDVGCGFGSVSLLLAHRGARVTALDPNPRRARVGLDVGEQHGASFSFVQGSAETAEIGSERFELALAINSLCYLTDPDARRRALVNIRESLRPGGYLVIRNPNRSFPLDPFTFLPFIHRLPPETAARWGKRLRRRHRPAVRLLSPRDAIAELERSGFSEVTFVGGETHGGFAALHSRLGRYQHLVARRPEEERSPAADQSGRLRRRASRALSRARHGEYRSTLQAAVDRGYTAVGVEQWLLSGAGEGRRVLVLRHDVDAHPRSALAMARVEEELGIRSTWYFRWRAADAGVISRLREGGHEIGLHYETLTRLALGHKNRELDDAAIQSCRHTLGVEVEAFQRLYGPIRSICPHGDTRVPSVHNGVLAGEGTGQAGPRLPFDCEYAVRKSSIRVRLTDGPPGSTAGAPGSLEQLLQKGKTPVLWILHPHHWASGTSLALDRVVSMLLPSRFPGRPVRTRSDKPPL